MFIIRPAQSLDADAIGRVHVEVWRETYPGIVPQRLLDGMNIEARAARWREILINQPTDQFLWLAFDGGALTGFCGGGPAREAHLGLPAEIFMINILKSGQRGGVGRALMRHAAQSLIAAGHQSAGLWVFVENHNARAFYRRLGGVETDIRQDMDFDGKKRPELAVHWADLKTLTKSATE
jgi:ribosomal protein S18 acetylase RimI-like enzyme